MHQYQTLANGLVVGTEPLLHTQTVAINLLVKVGSRHEPKALNGISHFLEHMSFKGTKTRTAQQIAQEFELLGAHFNAYTSREHTVYTVFLLKEYVEQALEILSDIILNSVFAEEEVERERTVILQEIAQSLDTPEDVVFDNLQEVCFADQAIGRTILGPSEVIKAITAEDLKAYVKKHYHAKQIVLSVAGNVTHDRVMLLANKYFAQLADGPQQAIDLPQYKGGSFYQQKDLEQVNLLLSFQGVSWRSEDYYVAELFTAILGGGMSSRLFQEVREKRGLVYSVGSYNLVYSDVGTFNLFAGTEENKVDEVIKIMAHELRNMENGITDEELLRVKQRIKTALMSSKEMSSHRAAELASDYSIYGRHITAEETLQKIDQVSKDDIAAFARKIYASSPVSFSVIGKVGGVMDYNAIQALFR